MEEKKSRIGAGLLGILLGGFGAHNFYLGYTGKAVAQLLITWLSFGLLYFISSTWGLIEGILILVGTINKDADYKVQVFIDDDYNLYYQDNHAFASCESKIVDNKVETIWNSCKCWFKITGLYECRNNHMVDILRDLNSYSEYLYPKNNVADNVMLSRLYEQMVNVYLDYVND